MVYQGKVHNGVVILENGANLPEGIVVRVEPLETEVSEKQRASPEGGLFEMSKLAVDTGIPDLAQNIDHYLYGHQKVDDGK